MGQKDITEKLLEDYEDVFADIVNVLLFHGKPVVTPDSLESTNTKSQYKADDSVLHEQERDVSKLWKDQKVTIAIYGIENQTKAEKVMPLRILSYDGASYRSQLLKDSAEPPFPVISLVLYYGKAHWNQPKNLKALFALPPELEPYVSDYQINVFEISWLTDEQVALFQSDFRIVAEFFTQIRKDDNYIPSSREIKHVDAVLKTLSVFAESKELEQLVTTGKSKEVSNMCEAINKIVFKGVEEGRAQGLAEGIAEGRAKGIAEGRAKGIAEGHAEGLAKGISEGIAALVATLKELQMTDDFILEKVMEKFSLTESEAKQYL